MVQSLESYVAEATRAYQPSTTAIQNQLDALSGRLATTNEQINRNYAQQQAGLNRQRSMAAETASMQAAGSGGSFGGAANIANRKYYDQSFVPAVTQMRTNQTNELAAARQANEDQRLSYESQLANLQAQANQQALAQYYADLEAERAREAQLKAARISAAASNPWQYLPDGYSNTISNSNSGGYNLSSSRNQYGGYDWTDSNGRLVRAGGVAAGLGGDFNSSLKSVLEAAARQGDAYSQNVLNEINKGYKFALNTGGSTGNAWYDTLGVRKIYTPTSSSSSSVASTSPSLITRGTMQKGRRG